MDKIKNPYKLTESFKGMGEFEFNLKKDTNIQHYAFNEGIQTDRKAVIKFLDEANDLKDLEARLQELKKGCMEDFKGGVI